jgi:hypothetical protein
MWGGRFKIKKFHKATKKVYFVFVLTIDNKYLKNSRLNKCPVEMNLALVCIILFKIKQNNLKNLYFHEDPRR